MLSDVGKLILRSCVEGYCDLYQAWIEINTAYPSKSKEENYLSTLKGIEELIRNKLAELWHCQKLYDTCEKITSQEKQQELLNNKTFWEPKGLGDKGVYIESNKNGNELFKKISDDKILRTSWI